MGDFPSEVVEILCNYISFEDRRQVALVNSHWNYGTQHPAFLKNELFSFEESLEISSLGLDDNTPDSQQHSRYKDFEQTLLNSKREIINLKLQFNGIQIDVNNLLQNLGDRIWYIDLGGLAEFSDMCLDAIMGCSNLKTLKLSQIVNMSITKKPRLSLTNVKTIFFNKVDLSDLNFTIITSCFPNLEDIGFRNCDLLVWSLSIFRYYPESRNLPVVDYNSDYVFTVENVAHFINFSKSIKSLRLEQNAEIILKLSNDIKLNHLTLSDMYSLSVNRVNKLVSTLATYTSLQELIIMCCSCFLVDVIPKLHNLKHLKIKFRTNIHSRCDHNLQTVFKQFAASLSNMTHLKTLAFDQTAKIEPCPFKQFVIPKHIIKSLTTLKSPLCNTSQIIQYGTNLTTLKIHNGNVLKEKHLVLLFKKLTSLRYLNIKDCVNLTDKIIQDSPISNLKELKRLQILGSKLTYQCLPHIQIIGLKDLFLDNLSLKVCIDQDDLSDFESCIKQFGSYVPSLISCKLLIKDEDGREIYTIGLDLFTSDYKLLLMSFFKKIKYFDVLCALTNVF